MPSREVEKKHRYKPYFRKANDQEKKQFKCLKRTMMNSGTQERWTERAGALADMFAKNRSVEKCVWQDEKVFFTLNVSLNSQNSCVYGIENKDNIQYNRLFHHTNRHSKKVMVSVCVTWNVAPKTLFVNDNGLKINSKT